MSAVEGVVVYVITWWLVLFMVLPWGVRAPEDPGLGHAASAPSRPRLVLKMGITTGIAALLWLGIFVLVSTNLISFRPG